MNILEEFIERKKLKNVPAVHHCIDGTIIIRQSNPLSVGATQKPAIEHDSLLSCISPYCYVYLIIRWNEKPRGPGSYSVQFASPVKLGDNYKACIRHSDSLNRNFVFKNLFMKSIEYDDFETTMLGWIESIMVESRWFVATTKDDAYFMLWESFVFMFDRYFADLPAHVKSSLWDSMNVKNDKFSRKNAITAVIGYVDEDCKSVSDLWARDFVLMSHGFCKWISSLSWEKTNQVIHRDIT